MRGCDETFEGNQFRFKAFLKRFTRLSFLRDLTFHLCDGRLERSVLFLDGRAQALLLGDLVFELLDELCLVVDRRQRVVL